MDDEKMIEALNRIAAAQEDQTKEWKEVKNELCEIRESIKRIHQRLDDTARETTINTERISNLKEQFTEEKAETASQINIAHESIRRRDSTLKWIAASIVMPVVLALIAIFKPS